MNDKSYKYSQNKSNDIDTIITESHNNLVQLERRNLLIVSSILLSSSLISLNPEKATFLGFTFDHLSEKHFYFILIFMTLYFLTAFLVYGYPKFRASIKSKEESMKKATTITITVRQWHIEWPRLWLDLRYWGWLSFHYLLPILISIWALFKGLIKIV